MRRTGRVVMMIWMVALVLGLTAGAGAEPALYHVILVDLPYSYGMRVNDLGEVVGWFQGEGVQDGQHTFLWSPVAGWADLGPYGWPMGINNGRQVVMWGRQNNPYPFHSFLWDDGTITHICQGQVTGINDAGQIACTAPDACVWETGVMRSLLPEGFWWSAAHGINDPGDVICTGQRDDGEISNFVVWCDGTTTDLGDIDPRAINDAGQVMGQVLGSAVLWDNGVLTDLGTLGGSSVGKGLNDAGWVVGRYLRPDLWAAFVHDGEVMYDLNDLLDPASQVSGWHLAEADDINDAGWIVGFAVPSPSGPGWRAFVAIPVQSAAQGQLWDLGQFIFDEVDVGRIDPELENPLVTKVDSAIAALEMGNANAAKVAMNDLKALVNQVQAQAGNKIDPLTAQQIIDAANEIIAALEELLG